MGDKSNRPIPGKIWLITCLIGARIGSVISYITTYIGLVMSRITQDRMTRMKIAIERT